MGPIANPRRISVLHRIEVNVINVTCQIGVVADRVLPIAALPNPLVALGYLAGAALSVAGEPAREAALDEAPARVTVKKKDPPWIFARRYRDMVG
jgi:hypothetical protein